MKLSNKISLAILAATAVITITTVLSLKSQKEDREVQAVLDSYTPIYNVIEKARTARLKYVDESFNDCVAKEGFDKCVNLSSLTKDQINAYYDKMIERTNSLMFSEIQDSEVIKELNGIFFGLSYIKEAQLVGVGKK